MRAAGSGRLVLGLGLIAVLVVTVPAIAADPSPSALPSAAGPEASEEPKQQKPGKRDDAAEAPLTLSGVVEQSTDGRNRPVFTITVDGVVWELSAGPKWFHGAKNPLAAWVGQRVDIAGTHRPGSGGDAELDVETVNGVALRSPGRPSWAGGPKVVGEIHPGWKDWKVDKPGRAEGPPGQLKDKFKDRDPDDAPAG